MLEAVEEIVDIAAPDLLTMDQLGAAFERFKVVLDTSTQRRHERLQRRSAEDFDQEEAEAVEVRAAVPVILPLFEMCSFWKLTSEHSHAPCSWLEVWPP